MPAHDNPSPYTAPTNIDYPAVHGAATATGRILRRPEVLRLTGLSTSTLYAMMARGDFPRPLRLGKRAVGWPASIVHTWISTRIEASN